jgi:hypothetical protein
MLSIFEVFFIGFQNEVPNVYVEVFLNISESDRSDYLFMELSLKYL